MSDSSEVKELKVHPLEEWSGFNHADKYFDIKNTDLPFFFHKAMENAWNYLHYCGYSETLSFINRDKYESEYVDEDEDEEEYEDEAPDIRTIVNLPLWSNEISSLYKEYGRALARGDLEFIKNNVEISTYPETGQKNMWENMFEYNKKRYDEDLFFEVGSQYGRSNMHYYSSLEIIDITGAYWLPSFCCESNVLRAVLVLMLGECVFQTYKNNSVLALELMSECLFVSERVNNEVRNSEKENRWINEKNRSTRKKVASSGGNIRKEQYVEMRRFLHNYSNELISSMNDDELKEIVKQKKGSKRGWMIVMDYVLKCDKLYSEYMKIRKENFPSLNDEKDVQAKEHRVYFAKRYKQEFMDALTDDNKKRINRIDGELGYM
ncbi:MAG: hypothetical protein HQL70_07810 [Magnetococcales bacterium]|nr:hypothetical protein [Magnetococcales bacterium]